MGVKRGCQNPCSCLLEIIRRAAASTGAPTRHASFIGQSAAASNMGGENGVDPLHMCAPVCLIR